MAKEIRYNVYEISKEHRKHGVFIHSYKTKKSALKSLEKSIYRYMKEVEVIVFQLK